MQDVETPRVTGVCRKFLYSEVLFDKLYDAFGHAAKFAAFLKELFVEAGGYS